MKRYVKFFLFIVLFAFSLSCEKEEKEAGCDINGIWMGKWESESDYAGTFFAEVEQDRTHFEVGVDVWILSPDERGYYSEVKGTVKNKNVRVTLPVGCVDIFLGGDVSDTSTVEGNFSIPDLQMQGTYSGEILPSSTVSASKIYSFSTNTPGEKINDLLCVDDELWLFTFPDVYVNYEAMLKIIIIDFEGNVRGTSYFPYGGYDYFYDGYHIWTIENAKNLKKFDVEGNLLETFELPFSVFRLISDGQYLYFPVSFQSMLKTDMSINILDTIYFDYVQGASLIYNDSFLSYWGNVLYQSDKEGYIQRAYRIDGIVNILDIVTNNDKLWALVEEGDYEPDYDLDFYIYQVSLE